MSRASFGGQAPNFTLPSQPSAYIGQTLVSDATSNGASWGPGGDLLELSFTVSSPGNGSAGIVSAVCISVPYTATRRLTTLAFQNGSYTVASSSTTLGYAPNKTVPRPVVRAQVAVQIVDSTGARTNGTMEIDPTGAFVLYFPSAYSANVQTQADFTVQYISVYPLIP